MRAITGLHVRECTSGFRCWRREARQDMPLDRIASNVYAFLMERTWAAAAAWHHIAEEPITFVDRQDGASANSTTVPVIVQGNVLR